MFGLIPLDLTPLFSQLGLSVQIVFGGRKIPQFYEGWQWIVQEEGDFCSVQGYKLPLWEVWFRDRGRHNHYILSTEKPTFPYHDIVSPPLEEALLAPGELSNLSWYLREERQMLCWGIKRAI
ncbi:MAG: hypothetical protein GX842_05320 [Spirochaetales bacterium]|jgi:hypothetical protein|nr:hypothetical protein [Spirochaetales bacterium]